MITIPGQLAIKTIHGRVFATDVSIITGKIFFKPRGSNAWGCKFYTRHRASRQGASSGNGVKFAGPGVVGVASQTDQAFV